MSTVTTIIRLAARPHGQFRHWGLSVAAAFVLLAAGCGTLDPRRDADYHDRAGTVDRPVVRPIRSISSFSPSLGCMDHMLRAADVPTTLISTTAAQ